MTETADSQKAAPKRRQLAFLLLLLATIFAAVWFIRAAYWPCGALDRTSGCVSSVTLDVGAVGLDPSASRAEYLSFDLGPGGKLALVGLKAETEDGWHLVLATFDTATGAPVQKLHDSALDREEGEPWIWQAALSPDATLAAAAIKTKVGNAWQSDLNVYRLVDGNLLKTVWTNPSDANYHCTSMLGFSSDGKKLQCGYQVYDLTSGAREFTYLVGDKILYPMLVDFPGMEATAPDGYRFDPNDVSPGIKLFDADAWQAFAPDNIGFLDVWIAYRENRGQRLYTPPVFRRLSAVYVWNAKTKTLQRSFFANRRYVREAWSRDAAYFGFISDDLQLEVFTR